MKLLRSLATIAAVTSLLGLFAGLAISAARWQSVTYDELTHLPAGYTYLRHGDYRLNPEHPPLVKLWAALPLLAMDIPSDPTRLTYEQLDDATVPMATRVGLRSWLLALADDQRQWPFGYLMFYGMHDDVVEAAGVNDQGFVPTDLPLDRDDFLNNSDAFLLAGRSMVAILGAALGLLIFLWSRELFGTAGGLISLALFCLDPNFLAHSALVTTDVGFALFFFGTVYFLWRASRHLGIGSIAGLCLMAGAAVATKFSALLLLPVALGLAIVRLLSKEPWTRGRGVACGTTRLARLQIIAGLAGGTIVASYVLLWGVYGFRYSAAADPRAAAQIEERLLTELDPPLVDFTGKPREPSGRLNILDTVIRGAHARTVFQLAPDEPTVQDEFEALQAMRPNGSDETLKLLTGWRLFPEAFLYGAAFTRMHSYARQSYLLGEYSIRGFPSYFIWTLLLKTPLVTLLTIAIATISEIWKPAAWRSYLWYLFLPTTIYFAASLSSSLNIGHRHLLPVYPFLLVLCGALAKIGVRWPRLQRAGAALVLLAAMGINTQVSFDAAGKAHPIWPNYLGYFNEIAGGPREGYLSLVDSNVDWGQGLMQLSQWLEQRDITEPIYFVYFGTGEPQYYGIRYHGLGAGFLFRPRVPWNEVERPAYLVVSATAHQGLYITAEDRVELRALLRQAEFVDIVAGSMLVYRLPSGDAPIPSTRAGAHRSSTPDATAALSVVTGIR